VVKQALETAHIPSMFIKKSVYPKRITTDTICCYCLAVTQQQLGIEAASKACRSHSAIKMDTRVIQL
jgi:hypothetical protein